MDYHLFRKTVSGKNGKAGKRWYYWYYDDSGRQIKKSCKNCTTKSDAEFYIAQLSALKNIQNKITIEQICEFMYIPGSQHYERLTQYGRKLKPNTILEARRYLSYISKTWGKLTLFEIDEIDVQKHLLSLNKSYSWKNSLLHYFEEIFDEAVWYKVKVKKLRFKRFEKKSQSQSVLSTKEINNLFQKENFDCELFYLFFKLSLSAGLRLSEARAARAKQYLPEYKAFIIDGFLTGDGTIRYDFNKKGTEDKRKHRVVLLPDETILSPENRTR